MGRRPLVTRDQVLAAARQVFAERGFEGATLAAIAEVVGVSAAALLRHAPTKEALFAAAFGATREIRVPVEFLAEVPGDAPPAEVLRRIGEAFVPFVEARFAEQIARWMRARTLEEARGLQLPFDPTIRPTPPERALALVAGWLGRAHDAGRLHVPDAHAGALLLLSSLHSYVTFQQVLRVPDPPLPLPRYLDALVELWTAGVAATKAGTSP